MGLTKYLKWQGHWVKGYNSLKNATNDIKGEIHRSADVEGIKKTFTEIGTDNMSKDINEEIDKVREDIEDMQGPIKRIR